MDWQTFAMAWGPAIPILLVMLAAHRYVVFKLFPESIRALKKAMKEESLRADRRHKGHMHWQKKICQALQTHEAKSKQRADQTHRKRKRPARKKNSERRAASNRRAFVFHGTKLSARISILRWNTSPGAASVTDGESL